MEIDALRALATEMELSTGGNRSQLIARIEKARKSAEQNEGSQGANVTDPAASVDLTAPDPVTAVTLTDPVPTSGTTYCYTPKSGETLSLAGLIVPATGAKFSEPSPAHEAFVPYYLELTIQTAE